MIIIFAYELHQHCRITSKDHLLAIRGTYRSRSEAKGSKIPGDSSVRLVSSRSLKKKA